MERMKTHMKTIRDTLNLGKRPSSPKAAPSEPVAVVALDNSRHLLAEVAESLIADLCSAEVNKISSDTLQLQREYEIEK